MNFFKLGLSLVLFPSLSLAARPSSTTLMKIQNLLKPLGTQVSYSLRDLQSGEELSSLNGTQNMQPASVAKVVSSACSLWALGHQYQFETRFGYTGQLKAGVLNGDLVIAGGGDPSFVIEDLKEILEKLYVLFGIHQIKGSLVFDTSYFAEPSLEIANGFEGDSGRAFAAQLSAVPLNFNAFSVWVAPVAGQIQAEILPRGVIDVKLVNKVALKPGPAQVNFQYQPDLEKVTIAGTMPVEAEPKATYRALPDPYPSFARVFGRVWSELGGRWDSSKFKIETKPVKVTALYRHPSKALSRILLDINKLSTNFGADMVLLSAGAALKGRPASTEKARAVLEDCVADFGISKEKLRLENASGLSRSSSVQATALTQFMSELENAEFWPEYLSTLSVLGRDGTTRRRLNSMAGLARLKTGTLQGIKTIAGYLFPEEKDPLVLVILFKCPTCEAQKLEQIEDSVLRILLEEK